MHPIDPKISSVGLIDLGENSKGERQIYIPPELVYSYSQMLAEEVILSGFIPDGIVVIKNGGVQVGAPLHEYMEYKLNRSIDYLTLKATSYDNMDNEKEVIISIPRETERIFTKGYKTLFVDDLYDTGNSLDALGKEFGNWLSSLKKNRIYDSLDALTGNVRTAALIYKPEKNEFKGKKTILGSEPDFRLLEGNEWVIFKREFNEIHNYTKKEQRKMIPGYSEIRDHFIKGIPKDIYKRIVKKLK